MPKYDEGGSILVLTGELVLARGESSREIPSTVNPRGIIVLPLADPCLPIRQLLHGVSQKPIFPHRRRFGA